MNHNQLSKTEKNVFFRQHNLTHLKISVNNFNLRKKTHNIQRISYQICSFIALLPTFIILLPNSTPIVCVVSSLTIKGNKLSITILFKTITQIELTFMLNELM